MKKTVHTAATRIVNDLGWLRIHASFREDSPVEDRRQFGSLLIVDDAMMIPGGRGFKLHPHQNMEIISWVISGTDEHNDSKQGINLIPAGHVQLMSAGTGIEHAENNYSEKDPVHMFQIWIAPKEMDIAPNYQSMSINNLDWKNKLVTFISPDGSGGSLRINQDAYVSLLELEKDKIFSYAMHSPANGLYIMVLLGEVNVQESKLNARDAVGIEAKDPVNIAGITKAEILFIEVPMN